MNMELDQSSSEIPLPVGTEVSAKFKGAFCEARVKKLVKSVKVKVMLKDLNTITVDDLAVKLVQGERLEVNQHCEVVQGKHTHKGIILSIKDCSTYTVVFNDGDERILKRTQLCPKSGKHFKEMETLDKLPLYHPDKRIKKKTKGEEMADSTSCSSASSTPRPFRRSASVTPLKGIASTRSATRAIAKLQFEEAERSSSAAECPSITPTMSPVPKSKKASSVSPCRLEKTNSDIEEKLHKKPMGVKAKQEESNKEQVETKPSSSRGRTISSSTDTKQHSKTVKGEGKDHQDGDQTEEAEKYVLLGKQFPPGRAVLINESVSPKYGSRIQLGMVVSMDEFKSQSKGTAPTAKIEQNQVPVRSFQNGRYHFFTYDRLSLFDPNESRKLTDFGSMGLKVAFERANLYMLKGELPQSWTKKTSEEESTKKKLKEDKEKNESDSTSESSSDEDPDHNERRDLCVAHFYKFQEESGTALNKVPLLGGKEIDIHRFYDVVSRMGGHKRVTQESGWRRVLRKLHLAQSGVSPVTAKNAYLRYFEKFEAFMKNLGSSSLSVASQASTSSHQRTTRIVRAYTGDHKESVKERKKRLAEKRAKEKLERAANSNTGTEIVAAGHTSQQSTNGSALSSRSASICSAKDPSPAMFGIKSSTEKESSVSASVQRKPSQESVGTKEESAGAQKQKEEGPKAGVDQSCNLPTESTSKSPAATSSEIAFVKQRTLSGKSDDRKLGSIKKRASVESVGSHSSADSQKTSGTNGADTKSKESQRLPQPRGRKPKISRENRVQSPSGHQAVLEDVGYTNAHLFTRFYQGQNVHARHHLRFYDARVITVKQPTLAEIAKALRDAHELTKLTHPCAPILQQLTLQNMGQEMKDALNTLMNSTKIFVHYLGWNSRYDEWLMLHKIRVDEKDERASSMALEQIVPDQLAPELLTIALDWCHSSEGIPSLTSLPSAQSSEQRPRRLSSTTTTLAKSAGAVTSARKSVEPALTSWSGASEVPLTNHSHSSSPSVSLASVTSPTIVQSESSNALKKFTIPHLDQHRPISIPPTVHEEPANVHRAHESQSPTKTLTTSASTISAFPISAISSAPVAPIIYSAPPLPPQFSNTLPQHLIASSSSTKQKPAQPISANPIRTASSTGGSVFASNVGSNTARTTALTVTPYSVVVKSTTNAADQPPPASSDVTDGHSQTLKSTRSESSEKSVDTPLRFAFNEHTSSIEIAFSASSMEECTFSLKMTENQKPEMEDLLQTIPSSGEKTPTKDEQKATASTQAQLSAKKRKSDSAGISGAMSPPTKLGRFGKPIKTAPGKASDTFDSTDDEDEGMHFESTAALRARVLQKMEAEHVFDSYAFVGLPELEDQLAACKDDPDEEIRLIEERMRVLQEIYHTNKNRLIELERQHKKSVARKRQEKADARKL